MVTTRGAGRRCVALLLGSLFAACDGGSSDVAVPAAGAPAPAVRATGFDSGPVKTAAEYLLEPAFANADVARGELLGLACAACHKVRADEGTLIGPNLHGVFGRPAARVDGFPYSPALEQSGLIWTPVSLAAWLADPAGFVSGTTMAFTGYASAEDRRDLIAYLLRVTQ
jgi:cytochrome c